MRRLHKSSWREWRRPRKKKFRQYLNLNKWLLLGLIAVAFLFLEKTDALHRWGMFGLDPLLHGRIFKAPDIVLVEITDDDYNSMFHGRSPLDRSLIRQLVSTVAQGDPNLIVVDLDVSDPPKEGSNQSRTTLPAEVERGINSLKLSKQPSILWAQTIKRIKDPGEKPILEPVPALKHGSFAPPLFPVDSDGVVRRYLRQIEVNHDGSCKLWPTLAWAAFNGGKTQADECSEHQEPEDLFFNFSGDRYTFDTTDANSIITMPSSGGSNSQLERVFGGKTVVIGGNYGAARDEYFTPAGIRSGMELIAYALESENRSGGIRPASEIVAIVADLLFGLLIVWIGYYFRLPMALLLILVATFLLPILGSYIAFKTWSFWLGFTPIMLAAFLHVVIDNAKDLWHLENEVEKLTEENKHLKAENKSLKTAEEKPPNIRAAEA